MTTTIEDMKRQAKRIARLTTVKHGQALDVLAVQRGYTHWGALAQDISSKKATTGVPDDDGRNGHLEQTTLCDALEKTLGRAFPAIAGCRHLIVSGAEATGKTTLLSLMLDNVGANIRVAAIEYTREFRLPPNAVSLTFDRTAPDAMELERKAMDEALSARPDLLVIGGMSFRNVAPIIETMARPDGPMVATIVHATDVRSAHEVIGRRLKEAGRADLTLPPGVGLIQMDREHMMGRRYVSDTSMT